MYHSAEQTKRILAEQEILHSGEATEASLCQYKNLSCVRCCLPHIGGDSHREDFSSRYLGPGRIVLKFKNFNPLQDPKMAASGYEDSFPDVGKEEMEKRFSQRRALFLDIYDRQQPRESLIRYMEAVQRNEGYTYQPVASSGPVSLYLGGSVPTHQRKGGLPECQLLGFIDEKGTVGCLAHPLAESSQGYDGRDQVGFFHHTGCCGSVGCEASREFRFLSTAARKIFDKTVAGMSWYRYSRHATSVLVHYLRSYDHLLQRLDERKLLDALTWEQLVAFTNTIYDEWPLRKPGRSVHPPLNDSASLDTLDLLRTDIPLAEKIMYIALDTGFRHDHFARQLQQTRNHFERRMEVLALDMQDARGYSPAAREQFLINRRSNHSMAFRAPIKVCFADIDNAGIVYYPNFMHYFHLAMEEFFPSVLGIDYSAVLHERNVAFPTVHVECDFKRRMKYGNQIDIEVKILKINRSSITWGYRGFLHNEDVTVVEGRNVTVCVRTDTFEKIDVPKWLWDSLTEYMNSCV